MNGVIALVAGLLFGFGLDLARMTDPERVLGFLDVAGAWDPTLVFVLAGYCPGPALAAMVQVAADPVWFVLGLVVGMLAYGWAAGRP